MRESFTGVGETADFDGLADGLGGGSDEEEQSRSKHFQFFFSI